MSTLTEKFTDEYDSFGNIKTPTTPQVGASGLTANPVTNSVNTNSITDGQINAELDIVKGHLQSSNFETGVQGWQIKSDGSAEFESGYFRGDITGASGTFTGTITATLGTIGGWTIGTNSLTAGSGATTVGMDNSVTAGDDIRFYAGSATKASAPFRVTEAGELVCTSATVTGALTTGTGSIIDGQYLSALSVATGALGNLSVTAGKIDNATITATQIALATITGSNVVAGAITASRIKDATITATQIKAATITGNEIASATITGSNVVAGTISASRIKTGTITANQIANATITGAKIDTGTIEAGNIASGTITATQISGSAGITGGQIANATIIATNIGQNVITGSQIAAGAIQHSNIVAGTIVAADIGLAAITGSVIAANTITGSNLVNNTITATQIQNATITGSQIAATTVAGSNIVNNTITATQIQNATITSTQIAVATITGSNIVAGTIASSNIKDATIVGTDIAAATIAGSNIASATVTGSNIVAGAITASRIANATITANQVASGTITGSLIVAGAITASRISNLTITAGQIANLAIGDGQIGSVGVDKLTAGSITSKAISLAVTEGTGDSYLAAGKTDFTNVDTGIIVGIDDSDANKPKFYIGGPKQYWNWTGTGISTKRGNGLEVSVDTNDNMQTAIDAVSAAGGGLIMVANGTHNYTTDITVPSNTYIQGQNSESTIIDFGSNAAGFVCEGTDAYSTGTITITNSATTVTGDSTVWTSAMIGRSILLGGLWYPIVSRTSNTEIAIALNYAGENLAIATYVLAGVVQDVKFSNLTVKNSGTAALKVRYGNEVWTSDLNIQTSTIGIDLDDNSNIDFNALDIVACGTGLDADNTHFFSVKSSGVVITSAGAGFDFKNCTSTSINSCFAMTCATDGFRFTTCKDVNIAATNSLKNGSQGFELVSGNNFLVFNGCGGSANTSDGFKLTASSDNCSLTGLVCRDNGGYGVNIAASTCDNNQISSINYSGNVSGTFNDQGTGTINISGNPIACTAVAGQAISIGDALFVSDGGKKGTFIMYKGDSGNDVAVQYDSSTTRQAQKFVAPKTETVVTIKVYLKKFGLPTDNLTVGIQGDSGGYPDGSYISSGAVAGGDLTTSFVETSVTVSAALTANTTYHVVFQRTGASDVNNRFHIQVSTNNPYTGGDKETYANPNWSTSTDQDIDLKLYLATISAGRTGKASALIAGYYETYIGIARAAAATGTNVKIDVGGFSEYLTGLDPGIVYYLSDTPGVISSGVGTNSKKAGIAITSTNLALIIS
jgi:hypothetical protein